MDQTQTLDLSQATTDEERLAMIEASLTNPKDNAKYRLALYYASGIHVRKNSRRSFHWMEQAAMDGYYWAIRRLVGYYALGFGVEKNMGKAFACFDKAKENEKEYSAIPEEYPIHKGRFFDYQNDTRVLLKYRRTQEQVAATPELNRQALAAFFYYSFNRPKKPTDYVESVVPTKPKKTRQPS